MNKEIIFLVFLVGLFGFASLALASVTIPNPLGNTSSFSVLFVNLVGVAGGIIVALGGLMILVAGFLFMTSGGNPQKVEKAKTAILYAAIGMVVGGLATYIANAIVAAIKK